LASAGSRHEQDEGQETVAARAGTATSDTRIRIHAQDRNTVFFIRHTTSEWDMHQSISGDICAFLFAAAGTIRMADPLRRSPVAKDPKILMKGLQLLTPPVISGQVHYRCTYYQEFSRQRWKLT
jgi:hypothetical protein